MTRYDVEEIIVEEGLDSYSFFEDRADAENEIVIKTKNGEWTIYITDERASMITGSKETFDNEEDALVSFVKRLRGLNYIRKNFN